eukprot:9416959-Prorocentrum_lima.AAC.1
MGQDEGIIDMQFVEALAHDLEHDHDPPAHPPDGTQRPDGDLVTTVTVQSYAGEDISRASTPPLNHCPSPR